MIDLEGEEHLNPERESQRLSYMLGVLESALAYRKEPNARNELRLRGKLLEAVEAMSGESRGTWLEAWTRLMAKGVVKDFPRVIERKEDANTKVLGNGVVIDGLSVEIWDDVKKKRIRRNCSRIEINLAGNHDKLREEWREEKKMWDKKSPGYDGQWDEEGN